MCKVLGKYVHSFPIYGLGIKLTRPRPKYRSRRPEVFCQKAVLKNFVKFSGKHLCQSFFFNKVAGLRPASLLKKRLLYRCLFSCEFCEIFKNNIFYRTPLVGYEKLPKSIFWLFLDSNWKVSKISKIFKEFLFFNVFTNSSLTIALRFNNTCFKK